MYYLAAIFQYAAACIPLSSYTYIHGIRKAGWRKVQLPNAPQRFSPEELIYGNIKRCIEPFADSGAILSEELYGDCYRCRVQVRRITDHNGKRRWLISEMFITNYVSENEKGYACIRILQNCIKEYCLYLYLPL